MIAVYRGRRARLIDETVKDRNDGPRLDYGDGLLFRVDWGDENLIVDPTDCEWDEAEPMLPPIDPRYLHKTKDETTIYFGHKWPQ